MSDPSAIEADAALLKQAIAGASDIAMQFFGNNPENWTKGDISPVSEADIAVNDFLHDALLRDRPGYGWLSEESADDPARLEVSHVWIVDPIDGTRVFLEGKPEFTVCAGLAINGVVEIGAVINPAKEEHYFARRGEGAFLNGAPLHVLDRDDLNGTRILSRRNVVKADRWNGDKPELKQGYIGSLAYQLCSLAAGKWHAAVSVNDLHEWDIAAAGLILAEAGGEITDQFGAALRYNQKSPVIDGMISAGPRLHRAIQARLIPKGA